ncbi:hypothetical protein EW146_g8893 [Bondarzewia mesenterica]|uniref:Uncharacterized protein n=1 Tax=Bondarzewia mesenterica TaxID=1095465 RepID=A0A4S4LC55_9AGAM|nr:hypothetical protein EW146_g8893 [Bondarzewia mesenterica]
METANQLLRDWRDINRTRGSKAAMTGRPPPRTQAMIPPPYDVMTGVSGEMDRFRLSGAEQPAEPVHGHQQPQQPLTPYDRRQQQPLPGSFPT